MIFRARRAWTASLLYWTWTICFIKGIWLCHCSYKAKLLHSLVEGSSQRLFKLLYRSKGLTSSSNDLLCFLLCNVPYETEGGNQVPLAVQHADIPNASYLELRYRSRSTIHVQRRFVQCQLRTCTGQVLLVVHSWLRIIS